MVDRQFAMSNTEVAGGVVVAVVGDLDLQTAEALTSELGEVIGASREVTVDLAGVTFLDSTGVRVLVEAHRAAQRAGGTFYIRGAQQWVAKVLDITGVAGLLTKPAP